MHMSSIKTKKVKAGVGFVTFVTVFTMLVLICGIYFLLKSAGKNSLMVAAEEAKIDVGKPDDEGYIVYKGKTYAPNKDLVSVLVMGIDKEGEVRDAKDGLDGGQADALFLMILDSHKEKVSVVAINRNTMADVDVFDAKGNYQGIMKKQIALQHGYGDGKEKSCERQVYAVSRLFNNIPISAYASINMEAIPSLNDAIGGIDVEVLDDIVYPEYNMNLHTGDKVTLRGKTAYWYTRLRNENVFNSNELRLARQKQYFTTYAAKAKHMAKEDIRVAINLYRTALDYMVTDIDISRFTYLATEAVDYDFDVENLYSLQGEVIKGNKFEEFYADEDYIKEITIQLFYEPVEE